MQHAYCSDYHPVINGSKNSLMFHNHIAFIVGAKEAHYPLCPFSDCNINNIVNIIFI